ncbi:MAG: hypothetical protein R3C11_18530 [Planctomycetaceae bacterium]
MPESAAMACWRSMIAPPPSKNDFWSRAQHHHPHQMLRVDREVRTPFPRKMESD